MNIKLSVYCNELLNFCELIFDLIKNFTDDFVLSAHFFTLLLIKGEREFYKIYEYDLFFEVILLTIRSMNIVSIVFLKLKQRYPSTFQDCLKIQIHLPCVYELTGDRILQPLFLKEQ